jgi:23S rRNA (uracil1939-C5)-methyltransferase
VRDNTELKVGDVVEVVAERMSYGGDAVARHNGLAIFIPLAATGEKVRVRVVERKKSFARAIIEEILTPSSSRREAPCQYFGECGGCQLQHIDYPSQLQAKANFVRDALWRIGKIEWPNEIVVHPSPEFGYRLRAQVKVERSPKGSINIGFTRAGSHAVCDVKTCPILSPSLDSALMVIRNYLQTRPDELDLTEDGRRFAEIDLASSGSGLAVTHPGLGELSNRDVSVRVDGADYTYSPNTFFQINRFMLDELVRHVIPDDSASLAIDLYAGVGLFTVKLARKFERVVAVESDRQTASYARMNAAENRASNITFHETMVETFLRELIVSKQKLVSTADLVLLDPPRSGAFESVGMLADLGARYITYVSCDPTTLARDIKSLVASEYQLENVVALDMFPQTYHVETIASLKKK